MQNRLRLLMGATALLYFGPLLAGLTDMGWDAVPVFIALFALWLVVMRPAQWPRDLARWTGQTALAAAAQVAVNALIVIGLFAIGRGIGGVAGFVPNIPPLVPVGLSFLATPLSRLIWNPTRGEALDRLMDDAIQQISHPDYRPLAAGPGDAMVETLLDLPADADPHLTAEALDAALRGREGAIRLSMLEDALDHLEPDRRALRLGLILWATDPARNHDDGLRNAPFSAFLLAGLRDDMLLLFATRGADLLRRHPACAADFPEASDVEMAIDAGQPADVQRALSDLAALLRTEGGERAGR